LADRIAPDAPVLVIGLGRFGSATAVQLMRQGRDVLIVDDDASTVQRWADRVTHAVQADARDVEALRQIGAADFSVAVVGVGRSIEGSVLITSNLVDLGVAQIWAKAISESHGRILTRIGATHVVYPEAEAGERTAHLVSGRMLDYIEFDDDFAIVKMPAPGPAVGRTIGDLARTAKHGVRVAGVKSPGGAFQEATADTVIGADDILIVSGAGAELERFSMLGR
jgi:trk system potassium uptake protein TrkA